jgi:hypothetical protein
MASFPIFTEATEGNASRIAINPENVASISEIEPNRLRVILSGGNVLTIVMSLENFIDRLTAGPSPAGRR